MVIFLWLVVPLAKLVLVIVVFDWSWWSCYVGFGLGKKKR